MPPRKDPDGSASVPAFYGAELRYKREAAGLTLEQLAEGSFRGISFLSQIERGERRMPEDLARHVDEKLKTDGFFARRCEDARRARQSGIAEFFADAAEMEQYAETIEDWAPLLVPGLLQTAPYARATMRSLKPWAPADEIEQMVAARLKRAKLLAGEKPPYFWAIIDENVIRRPVLPPEQMAELMDHIVSVMTATPSILQILPHNTTAHPFLMGLTRIMTFPDAPAVVYTEGLHSGQLIDYPALVKQYGRSYDLLRAAALSPEASLTMVEAAAGDYRNGKQSA
ncbi:helix-turn-helix domain-containing protein [Streptomyces sp. NPDC002446]